VMNDLRIGPALGNAGSMQPAGGNARVGQGNGFGEVLKESLAAVNSRMQEADELVQGLVSGQHANIHETMIAMEKASISFKLLAKVQSKVIGAYEEIQRIQL
jgi:flagellar hook-basal body complex protein FliE